MGEAYVRQEYDREKSWLVSQLPVNLYQLLKEYDVIVAGGAVTSAFSGKKVNDFDLFFRDKESRDSFISCIDKAKKDGFLLEPVKSPVAEAILDSMSGSVEEVFRTDTASTYTWVTGERKVSFQVVTLNHVLGDAKEVIGEFDFTVAMGAFLPKSGEFILHQDFLRDLAQRKLVYAGTSYPFATLLRVVKYTKRGFSVSGVDLLRLGLDLNDLELATFEDVIDQMAGIDVSLLQPLVEKLKEDVSGDTVFSISEFEGMFSEYLTLFFNKKGLLEPEDFDLSDLI